MHRRRFSSIPARQYSTTLIPFRLRRTTWRKPHSRFGPGGRRIRPPRFIPTRILTAFTSRTPAGLKLRFRRQSSSRLQSFEVSKFRVSRPTLVLELETQNWKLFPSPGVSWPEALVIPVTPDGLPCLLSSAFSQFEREVQLDHQRRHF